MIKLFRPGLTAASLALLPTAAMAQSLDYASGDYEYAEEQVPDEAVPQDQDQEAMVWVQRTVAQPIPTVEPDAHAVQGGAPPEGTLLYVYPAIYGHPASPANATRVIYRTHAQAPRGYSYVFENTEPSIPVGGRLVQFDRESWLDECSSRLSPRYADEEEARHRHRHHDAPLSQDDSRQRCEAYLDGYMRSAQTGGLHGQYSQSGEYMLVPVTVMVPQHAVYEDGTSVRR